MKDIYINGLGNVSPQRTFDPSFFLEDAIPATSNSLKVQDPVYKDYVPAEMVRRMSRIIKMGIAAGKICLQDAGNPMPDAIITGTGMGCLEDTEKFLSSMIRDHEEFLTPTSFIQSTHNTVGAQIALLLKCYNYNFTYVHRGFSFESALLDAILQIESGNAQSVLLGGLDEMTKNSFSIMKRMGHWKHGTLAGEGAAFFLLSDKKGEKAYGKIAGLDMFYRPQKEDILPRIEKFLAGTGRTIADIDLFIPGINGDPAFDAVYDEPGNVLFGNTPQVHYKHLSGEYHTANAFGLWLAAKIMEKQQIPEVVALNGIQGSSFRNILIYNHYRNINHTLILLTRN